MALDSSNSDTPNSTLLRGLAIMNAVANSNRPLSIADLVDELGLAKPTVHRIASQLQDENYLQRNPSDKRFIIGNKLKEFSTGILSNNSIGAPRRAILEALSNEIGESREQAEVRRDRRRLRPCRCFGLGHFGGVGLQREVFLLPG